MAGACRSVMTLCSVASVLIALLARPAGVSRADDVGLPPVSLTTTSGAPLRNGGTYGVGVVVNHDNAVWFYNFSVPGDVVEVHDTGGAPLQVWQNGDWSLPWDQWALA